MRSSDRRWAKKGSWRLTFTVWTIVLMVWGIVTLTIDYDTLVVIRDLFGRRWQGPALALGVVILGPMLVDALRNGLIHRRGLRASPLDAAAGWTDEVPAVTPRKFRGEIELTWRERAIAEQGQLAYGTVVHHGELSSVQFDTPWGDTIGSRPVAAPEPRPREGSRAPLLFEPGAHVGVAPSLLGLSFLRATTSDQRPALTPTPAGASDAEMVAPLMATLHPVERMSRYRAVDVGELSLDKGKLTLTPCAAEPVTVLLDSPFRVELSVFLLPEGRAELNVRIEPRTHTAYRASVVTPLQLKTEIAQARVDRRVDRGWVDACYIAPQDFDELWSAIVDAADDTALTSSVATARARLG